jgi:TRAP-type mannitol/chloroaromatic compound transport system permease small subunit
MATKLVLAYSRWLDRLNKWIGYTWWLLLLAAFYMTWEVVMRYFFLSPHEWFDEIMIHSCMLSIFCGCGATTWKGSHINLGLLYVHLKGRKRQVADIIHFSAVVILGVIMIIYSIKWGGFMDSQGVRYESIIGTPWSLLTYMMALGFALNAIYGLGLLLRACTGIDYEEAGKAEIATE